MRARLLAALILIMTAVIVLVGTRLGVSAAEAQQRRVFLDRLNDTARLASVSGAGLSAGDTSTVQADIDRLHEVFGIRSALLDQSGTVLASSDPPPQLSSPDVRAALATAGAGIRGGDHSLLLPWRHQAMVVAEPVDLGSDVVAVVVTASPTGSLHAAMLRAWVLIGVLGLALLAVLSAGAIWLTRWILRPVRALDDSAHQLATGQLSARVGRSTGPPELRRLAASFDEMADTVQSALEQQQAFVADASHQLRNPLNALLLRLQYLQLARPEEMAEELHGAEEEVWQLSRLVDDLLALAATPPSAGAAAPFAVDEVVAEAVAAWSAAARDKGLRLTGPPLCDARAAAPAVALRRSLDEAIGNAIKYTPAGGAIEVRIECLDGDGDGDGDGAADGRGDVAVVVADDGPGLPPENLGLAARRFWRAPDHQNVAGFGLGLSIAQALLEAAGGRLEFAARDPRGLQVRLVLPAARPSDPQQQPSAAAPADASLGRAHGLTAR